MGAGPSSPSNDSDESDPPKTFDIALVGLKDAGKTSILNRLQRPEQPTGLPSLPQPAPTIGYISQEVPCGQHLLTLWDFSAETQADPGKLEYWNVHVFIFAIDASSPEHIPKAKDELWSLAEQIRKDSSIQAHPVLVVATKIDKLNGPPDLDEMSRALDIEGLVKRGRTIGLKGVSAATNEGMEGAMQWVLENVTHAHITQHDETKSAIMRYL
ncbi:P-loop containing nucleoside triphosphate hydrolase protein [Mycena rosella]|uniref:P-loop containing nucleoside triphosphate hydrolase protein n=1 Tax=Mycena rosella TaxID=1033263 RepID=A0AAD7DVG5_MYCRO|nr:P-loop containing nucleoside triphosphate hydrolase protein [Mycena rosella]